MTYHVVRLFSGSSVAQLLAEQRVALDGAILTATENLRDPEYWGSAYRVRPLVMQRSEAEFDVQEDPGNEGSLNVTFTVPWTGDPRLLLASMPTSPGHPQPTVSVSDVPAKTFMINRKFSGTTADDIRTWARQTVEDIEAVTTAQRPDISRFNQILPEVADALLADRRQVLAGIAAIRKALGHGI